MKLFKRTSITLAILLLLLWLFMFMWVYYPRTTVTVTKTDITEVGILLRENNITVPDGIIKKKSHAIAGGRVIYAADDKEKYAKKILGKKAFMENDNTFTSKNATLRFDGKSAVISGVRDYLENVSIENAAGEATKLLQMLNMADINMTAHAYKTDDGFKIIFFPEYNKKPVFDCQIKVLINKKEFTVETIPVKFEKLKRKHLPQSACSALASFALADTANGSCVSDMTLGYKTQNEELVPVWAVYTEDDNTYYVN